MEARGKVFGGVEAREAAHCARCALRPYDARHARMLARQRGVELPYAGKGLSEWARGGLGAGERWREQEKRMAREFTKRQRYHP